MLIINLQPTKQHEASPISLFILSSEFLHVLKSSTLSRFILKLPSSFSNLQSLGKTWQSIFLLFNQEGVAYGILATVSCYSILIVSQAQCSFIGKLVLINNIIKFNASQTLPWVVFYSNFLPSIWCWRDLLNDMSYRHIRTERLCLSSCCAKWQGYKVGVHQTSRRSSYTRPDFTHIVPPCEENCLPSHQALHRSTKYFLLGIPTLHSLVALYRPASHPFLPGFIQSCWLEEGKGGFSLL